MKVQSVGVQESGAAATASVKKYSAWAPVGTLSMPLVHVTAEAPGLGVHSVASAWEGSEICE